MFTCHLSWPPRSDAYRNDQDTIFGLKSSKYEIYYFFNIMREEFNRLEELFSGGTGGLAVIWGRRRVGKTRLLLEWSQRHGGLYTVADQSAPSIQREFMAEAISRRYADFGSVAYPSWRCLLSRLASESGHGSWKGPVIFDEFPHLISADSSLASVFQNWIDHEAKEAMLTVAISGSSQRMMQGLVMDSAATLYGRSRVQCKLQPLSPGYMQEALRYSTASRTVVAYAVWGGIPWYWELAEGHGEEIDEAVDRCVLDPLSPLFREPERLLLEEMPPAISLRPLLDLIGAGVHRVSELAGRLGTPATSLSRPLSRLVELGLVFRETPYGESERTSKRSLYRISDPFLRLWFRVVAPNKAVLTQAPSDTRKAVWTRSRPALIAETWEELCRRSVPNLHWGTSELGKLGPWEPAKRYWRGNLPEWSIIAKSIDGKRLLIGEAKWNDTATEERQIGGYFGELLRKGLPPLPKIDELEVIYALFVPELGSRSTGDPLRFLVDAETVLSALRL
jgi:AAA+ ATPase superfamily predicted ATPase